MNEDQKPGDGSGSEEQAPPVGEEPPASTELPPTILGSAALDEESAGNRGAAQQSVWGRVRSFFSK